jgi:asparagine synthase (glutamine-hydrolysing)
MPRAEFPSIAQQTVYRWLSDPLLHWNLERLEQRYASRGRELRHPFFDRRLAELVLAIPFDKRVGPPGLPKALLRQAMQGLLLTEILERRTQAVFDTYFLAAWERWRPYLREVIHSSDPWLSEPYTDPKRVRPWLESALPESPHSMEVLSQAWAAVNLELWLRGLGRYSAAQYDEASQSLGEVDHA